MRRILSAVVGMLFLTAACYEMSAEISMSPLFTDNMVLQQKADAPVWGTATPGSHVEVMTSWNKRVYKTKADEAGKWMVKVATPKAGGPYTIGVREQGGETRTIENVLIGEVWLCSGQSNMEMPVKGWGKVNDFEKELKNAARYPKVRFLEVQKAVSPVPGDDFVADYDGWVECSPETLEEFSAVAYFFGRTIHLEKNVPVGLINTSWGGTYIEPWMSAEALQDYPEFADELANVAGWSLDKEERHYCTALYNAMISPLVPYAIKGAIWYQGCSNVGRAYRYRDLMTGMIEGWRKDWGYDFPFYITQLANYLQYQTQPEESVWAELRESQDVASRVTANTGLAVTIDIGDAEDIHPKNKQEVGRRLALQALNKTYGKSVVCSGPVYEGYEIEGNVIRIRFSSVAKGLVAKGGKLEGFTIAGADRQFYWAEARIVGDCVEVTCKDVERPLAVRYAWANNPVISLFNSEGLPAGPFRTDDWPPLTLYNTAFL